MSYGSQATDAGHRQDAQSGFAPKWRTDLCLYGSFFGLLQHLIELLPSGRRVERLDLGGDPWYSAKLSFKTQPYCFRRRDRFQTARF
jgi:hypothetical protein